MTNTELIYLAQFVLLLIIGVYSVLRFEQILQQRPKPQVVFVHTGYPLVRRRAIVGPEGKTALVLKDGDSAPWGDYLLPDGVVLPPGEAIVACCNVEGRLIQVDGAFRRWRRASHA